MFKLKFVDDAIGCEPEIMSSNDISNKKFLCKVVEGDPFEDMDKCCDNLSKNDVSNDSNTNKKLIITKANYINFRSKKYYNIKHVHYKQWDKQHGNRKRTDGIGRKIFI